MGGAACSLPCVLHGKLHSVPGFRLVFLVMDMLQTDVAGLTSLMLMPMLTAVFLSIPCGSLADRYGVKRVVCVGLAISVIGGFVRCFALGSMPGQLVAMFMLGCGIAALNANLAKVLGTWFREQTSLAIGFSMRHPVLPSSSHRRSQLTWEHCSSPTSSPL